MLDRATIKTDTYTDRSSSSRNISELQQGVTDGGSEYYIFTNETYFGSSKLGKITRVVIESGEQFQIVCFTIENINVADYAEDVADWIASIQTI
jgi:hypothetical protein